MLAALPDVEWRFLNSPASGLSDDVRLRRHDRLGHRHGAEPPVRARGDGARLAATTVAVLAEGGAAGETEQDAEQRVQPAQRFLRIERRGGAVRDGDLYGALRACLHGGRVHAADAPVRVERRLE